MSDVQLETTAPAGGEGATPEAAPSPAAQPVTASTPNADVEAAVKAAKAEAFREAQARFDKLTARERKAVADKEKALQAKLQSLGVDPQRMAEIDRDLAVYQKAQLYDELAAEADEQRQAHQMAAEIAGIYGLDPADARIQGTTSWDAYRAKCRSAAEADAKAERDRLVKDAAEARRIAVDRKIAAGELDTVGAAPAAPAGLQGEYDARKAKLPRGNVLAHTKLNQEFRKRGLKGV